MKAALGHRIRNWAVCLGIMLLIYHVGGAQDSSFVQGRTHEGFYLTIGLGPEFGNIKAYDNQGNRLEFQGTAYSLDFQIGGTILDNLILHATVQMKSIFGPTINSVKFNDNYTVDEFMMGIGLTYYFRNNYFVTGSLGSGNFSFVDENLNYTLDTDEGFSFQLKAGREWWVSPRWAIGFALEYGGTSVEDKYADGTREEWSSYRYGVRVTATMNGRNR